MKNMTQTASLYLIGTGFFVMESQNKFAIVAVVLIMMAAVAVFGFMSIAFDADDKFTAPHDYEVSSGTFEGHQVSGSGHSKYLNESQREYLYQFDTDISYQGDQTRSFKFNVICGSDHVPIGSIFSEDGAETIDGAECTWWHYVVEGERFDFALDGDMVVHKYSVSDVSGGWSFTSVLKS